MVKWTFAFRSVLTLGVSACIVLVCMGASVRGGAFGQAGPAAVIPASADLYVEINRGGTQGTALQSLWQAYQSHAGTAAALAPLRSAIGSGSMAQATTLLSTWGDRAGVAMWMPSDPKGQPGIAIVAQLKPSSFMNGANPLGGLATLTPATTYQGVQIFHVQFKDGTTGYGTVVSGNGVLTPDLATIERVVDTATFHAPSLLTSADFATTTAALPLMRAATVYIGARFYASVARIAMAGGATPPRIQAQSALLQHPYALAMVAAPNGLELVSSVVSIPGATVATTPNEGAGIVGNNAILYSSMSNLAATLLAPGVVPASAWQQAQQQTGIDVRNDLLSWMTGESVVDVNTGVSPAVGAVLLAAQQSSGSNGGGILTGPLPNLPGSLEMAWNVADPAAVQRSLDRVGAALTRATKSSTPLLTTTTLPDGTVAHTVAGLTSLGYAFRGHWLILSTNLGTDIAAPATPLAMDPSYTAALASVPGSGALTGVSYMDISRLLRVVDKWIAYTSKLGSGKTGQGAHPTRLTADTRHSISTLSRPLRGAETAVRQAGQQAGAVGARIARLGTAGITRLVHTHRNLLSQVDNTWQQIEPLIAPVRSIISVSRQVGTNGQQAYIFITVQP